MSPILAARSAATHPEAGVQAGASWLRRETRGPRPSLFLAFTTASLSGLVVLLHALGWVTLTYAVRVLAPLTAFGCIALLVRRRRASEDVLLNRLTAGLLAGVVGLLAYDLVRVAFLVAHFPFKPFRPIEVYGLLILDRYQDTALTKAAGWAFHIWNGLAFALMYTLSVGRGRLGWALAWSMTLEVAMLASYPSLFGIIRDWAFVTVTVTGHTAYGFGLHAIARRAVRW